MKRAVLEQDSFRSIACDVHLGRLAKWLRLSGYTTSIVQLGSKAYPAGQLVDCARPVLVLSRSHSSLQFIAKNELDVTVFQLKSEKLREQIAELEVIGLQIQPDPETSLCAVCGGELEKTPKASVLSELPEKVKKSIKEFWRCHDCSKIYWRGTHWNRMEAMRAGESGRTD